MPQRFSPLLISNLLIKPLRYFFSNYAGPDYLWDSDPKKTKIEIATYNDLNKIPVQEKPRILISRGTYTVTTSGLTDNTAQSKTVLETKGLKDEAYLVFINGNAAVTIEARNEGSVELMTDMVTHFLVWSRPQICDTQGFKNFAMPLTSTPPLLSKEDKEIFQVTLSIPYTMEENWNVKSEALKLNNFYMNLVP